jgi:hypothetical protein
VTWSASAYGRSANCPWPAPPGWRSLLAISRDESAGHGSTAAATSARPRR